MLLMFSPLNSALAHPLFMRSRMNFTDLSGQRPSALPRPHSFACGVRPLHEPGFCGTHLCLLLICSRYLIALFTSMPLNTFARLSVFLRETLQFEPIALTVLVKSGC